MPARSSLADHTPASLGAHLALATGESEARGIRGAIKALRHAFADDASGDAEWSDDALTAAGLGRWARPHALVFDPRPTLSLAERAVSTDGTERLLFRTDDDHLIESVLIPAEAGRDRPRTTLCISSQVGCARACRFCETGAHGLVRHLRPSEIVDQYRLARRLCVGPRRPTDRRATSVGPAVPARRTGRSPKASERPISNIVFMGMGEPFDNLPHVRQAIDLLSTQQAFDFAPSRITVSTVGRADLLEEFFATTQAELAISINAPDDQRRSSIMPINDRFDLADLREALVGALPRGRRVLLQYALFADFNDADADADALAAWVGDIPARVNVIPANPGPDPSLRAPSAERLDAFVARLQQRGVMALVRRPRGRDVGGACGQLAGRRRLEIFGSP